MNASSFTNTIYNNHYDMIHKLIDHSLSSNRSSDPLSRQIFKVRMCFLAVKYAQILIFYLLDEQHYPWGLLVSCERPRHQDEEGDPLDHSCVDFDEVCLLVFLCRLVSRRDAQTAKRLQIVSYILGQHYFL